MAILFHCDCGQRLKAPDGMAGRKAKCFQCGAAVRVPLPFLGPVHSPPPQPTPDLGIDLDEDREAPEAPEPPPRRPFWRDPVVLIGAAVPLAILLAFFGYLYQGWSHERFKQHIAAMKAEADGLARAGKTVEAYLAYDRLLRYAGEPGDGQAKAEVAMARKAHGQLEPEAKAAMAKEAENARFAAEERRRYEEYLAKRDRLARIETSVEGTVWVEMKIGTTRPIAGSTVYFLRRFVRAAEVPAAWRKIAQYSRLYANVSRRLGDTKQAGEREEYDRAADSFRTFASRAGGLGDTDPDLATDVRQFYVLSRTYFGASTREHVLGDDLWTGVASKSVVAKVDTSIDGKYKIEAIPGGEYYVYALWYNDQSLIEWMFPLEVDQSPKVVCDLHNNKAALILNKNEAP